MTSYSDILTQFDTVSNDLVTLQYLVSAFTFPHTPLLDDFTRTAENPLSDGSAWLTSTPGWGGQSELLQTDGSQAFGGSPGNSAGSAWGTTFDRSVEVYFDVPTVATDQFIFGWASSPDGGLGGSPSYYAICTGSAWSINSEHSGTLANGTWGLSDGDSVGMSISDQGLVILYQKTGGTWGAVGHGTDNSYSGSGYIGLAADDPDTRFANFGGGTPA